MCFGIKFNQQQQLGSKRKGITSSTKKCSPASILPNLQTTISYSIDYTTAISIEIESLLVGVSIWDGNITYAAWLY